MNEFVSQLHAGSKRPVLMGLALRATDDAMSWSVERSEMQDCGRQDVGVDAVDWSVVAAALASDTTADEEDRART
jgi:hypothetical protein